MVSEKSWQTAWMRSKDNPLLFVTDVLGAKREPWQALALEAVGRHDRVSIRSGHGVGKTTFESWLILWFLLTRTNCKRRIYPGVEPQQVWPYTVFSTALPSPPPSNAKRPAPGSPASARSS